MQRDTGTPSASEVRGFDKEDTTTQILVGDAQTESVAAASKRDRCALTVLSGAMTGTLFTVDQGELVLGRGSEAGGRIQDPGLSRRHARLFRRDDGFFLEDLGSTNGTYLNGSPVTAVCRLTEGDRIQMGASIVCRVHLQDEVEQEATRRLYESAVRDPLTQVHNRRYLDERLVAEVAYARRHLTPLSVLLVDLDYFKHLNDTAGHLAGDAVLRVVAASMQRILRTEDLVARYGGEEFCVVARGIDERNARIVGERIRSTVEGLAIPWEERILRVTLSVGLATMHRERPYPEAHALLAAADAALYRAKSAGRNQCST